MALLARPERANLWWWSAVPGVLLMCAMAGIVLLILAGCKDSQDKAAQDEISQLKSQVTKLEASLRAAKADLANAREELEAAVQMRDTLDSQAGKLTKERDEALELAKAAEEAILNLKGRLKQADGGSVQVQGQVAQLQATIQQLQTTITQQQAVIAELDSALQQQAIAAADQMGEIQQQEPETEEPEGGDVNNITP